MVPLTLLALPDAMGNSGALWVVRLTKTLSFKFIKKFCPNKEENKTGKTLDVSLRIPYTCASTHIHTCIYAHTHAKFLYRGLERWLSA